MKSRPHRPLVVLSVTLFAWGAGILLLLSFPTSIVWGAAEQEDTPTPISVTVSLTPSVTPSNTPTDVATDTPLPSNTPTLANTPTNTPLPTPTDQSAPSVGGTATSTPTPSSTPPAATQIFVDHHVCSSNELSHTIAYGESRYFKFWGKSGIWYEIKTDTGTTNNQAIDTYLRMYSTDPIQNPAAPTVAENDDISVTDVDSIIQYYAQYDSFYWIEVQNIVPDGSGDYCLTIKQESVTQTPNPAYPWTKTPWDDDDCEKPAFSNGNGSLETACEIVVEPINNTTGTTPTSTVKRTFAPPTGQGPDSDFYKIWVKNGQSYTCETFDLSPNNDTNMIMYDANGVGLAGNDDIAPGNLASRVTEMVTYNGWLYILVGPYVEINYEKADTYTYKIRCFNQVRDTPTPDPQAGDPKPFLTDKCELNDTFNVAAACALEQVKASPLTYQQQAMNFEPFSDQGVDVDFYKIWVKENTSIVCKTDVANHGTDTIMTIYHESNPTSPLVDPNDDSNGGLGSQVSVSRELLPTKGWVLIKVESAITDAERDGEQYKYDISCTLSPGVSLPSSVGPMTSSSNGLQINPAAAANAPASDAHEFSVQIYYDGNDDGGMQTGEEIEGVPVILVFNEFDVISSVTNLGGVVSISRSDVTASQVQLIIPYLGVNQSISLANLTTIVVRVKQSCACQ